MSDDVANEASNEVVGVLSPTAAVPETVSIVKVNPAPPVAVAPNHPTSLQAPVLGGAIARVEVSVAGIYIAVLLFVDHVAYLFRVITTLVTFKMGFILGTRGIKLALCHC